MAGFTSGLIIGLEIPLVVQFQWNPQKMTRTKDVQWAQLKPAGREAPIYHYGCGSAQIYTFEAEFSRSDNGSGYVASMIDALMSLTKPLVKGAGVNRPPLVQLILGSFISVQGVINNVSAVYGPLFHPSSLSPHDAKYNVTIHEII
jgi:hypothetical protein